MPKPLPTTVHVGISEARAKLSSLVNDVHRGDTRVVLEKSGIPVAVLVPATHLYDLERRDRDLARLGELLDEMSLAFAGVSEEELVREADLAVEVVRQRARAERLAGDSAA